MLTTELVTTQEQLEECFNIRVTVFVKEQNVPREEELDEYDESPKACRHFLVRDGSRPVGTSRWKVYEEGVAKLQRIAVMKDYRSKGIGRLLVIAMEEDAKQQGMHTAILDGQCTAEGFYHRLGYKTESTEPFLDAGILHVRMSKEL